MSNLKTTAALTVAPLLLTFALNTHAGGPRHSGQPGQNTTVGNTVGVGVDAASDATGTGIGGGADVTSTLTGTNSNTLGQQATGTGTGTGTGGAVNDNSRVDAWGVSLSLDRLGGIDDSQVSITPRAELKELVEICQIEIAEKDADAFFVLYNKSDVKVERKIGNLQDCAAVLSLADQFAQRGHERTKDMKTLETQLKTSAEITLSDYYHGERSKFLGAKDVVREGGQPSVSDHGRAENIAKDSRTFLFGKGFGTGTYEATTGSASTALVPSASKYQGALTVAEEVPSEENTAPAPTGSVE